MDAREKPLILILVKRAAILMFALCAISLFYWVVGSTSSFLDETQSMLIDIMKISSLGIIVAAGFGMLVAIALAVSRHYALKSLGLAGYALAAAIGAAALAIAQSVSTLSQGLR